MKRKFKKYASAVIAAAVMFHSVPAVASDMVFFDEEAVAETVPGDPTGNGDDETDMEFIFDSGDSVNSVEENAGENSEDMPDAEENVVSAEFGDASTEEVFGDGKPEEEDLFRDGEPEEEGLLAGELMGNGEADGPILSSSGVSDNSSRQNYSVWFAPVYSYLSGDNTGYMRVEFANNQVIIERYNFDLQLLSQKYINKELAYFGGFYEGSNAYYLVFGQSNTSEDDAAEVIRVVKYDKNWNRLGAASLNGANTTEPFYAGSLRMAEYGGYLYIRTCHEMYTTPDGLNHQANLMMQVRTSDMRVTDAYYNIMNIGVGYVSHSFNQFILADDSGNLVALDHGDAYPRSAVLGKYNKKAGESSFSGRYSAVDILKFQGGIGWNTTDASLGGLEYSDSCYLTAGNSIRQDSDYESRSTRNIFLAATSRSNFSESGTSVKWLTSYEEGGSVSASTPHLVKLGSGSFLLLWEQMSGYRTNGNISYVFLDGAGNPTSSVYTQKGYLSDCKPTVSNGTVIWYATDGEKLTFYKVKKDGSYESEVGHIHSYEPKMKFANAEVTRGLIEGSVKNPLTTNSDGVISYSSSDASVASVDSNGTVKLKKLGTCTITATAKAGVNYAAKSVSYTLKVLPLKKQVITVTGSFSKTYGDSIFSINASCLGGAKLTYSSDNEKVLTVSEKGIIKIVGTGKASVTVKAERNSEYIGASAKTTITVNRKSVKNFRLIFTKIGPISSDISVFEKCIAVYDGDRVLKEWEDFEPGGSQWWGSSNDLYSLSKGIRGIGNYTGDIWLDVVPIRKAAILNSVRTTARGIQVAWTKEGGAIGYCIYRKTGNGSYKLVKRITNRDTVTWTDTEMINPGQTCSYYVKSYTKSNGKNIYSSRSAIKTIVPAPTLKSALSAGYNSVKVTWNAVPGAGSYKLYYKGGSVRSWKLVKYGITGTSYTHSGLTAGTSYSYTVQVVYGGSAGSYGKSVKSVKPVPAKAAITSVKKYGTGMRVSYKKVSGATGYLIQRYSGKKWVTIAKTRSLSYVDSKANKKGAAYKYRVRAYRTVSGKNIYGAYSTAVTGKR